MNTTDLALIIERSMGAWLILIGLSHLTQRRKWLSFVADIESHAMLGMMVGMIASAVGLFVVFAHGWSDSAASIITVIMGGVLTIKGAGYMLFTDKMAKAVPGRESLILTVLAVGGFLTIGLGVWLSVLAWG